MIPTIVARYDEPPIRIESHDGQTEHCIPGVTITVECEVDDVAGGLALLDRAVAEIRRQLVILGPPIPVLVPGRQGAQDA